MSSIALPVVEKPAARRKPRRDELGPGDCLCAYCPAKCCQYYALPIDKPTDWQDFDYLRWFLLHEGATLFVEEGTWYLMAYARCKHLGQDNRCLVYHERPQICRDYGTDDCEYEDDWLYDHYFETAEQVEEYAEAVLPPRPGCTLRTPKPPAKA